MPTMFLDRLNIDKFLREELEETLVNSTTLLAVVGAGDLAMEKLRAAHGELMSRTAAYGPRALREQAQSTLADHVGALQSEMLAAPEHLKALPERAQELPARAQSLLADLVSAAFSTYGELAGRGKTVVEQTVSTQTRGAQPAGADVPEDIPVSRPPTPSDRTAAPTSERAPSTAPDTARKTAAKTTAAKAVGPKPKARKSAPTKSAAVKSAAVKSAAVKSAAVKSPAPSSAASDSVAGDGAAGYGGVTDVPPVG